MVCHHITFPPPRGSIKYVIIFHAQILANRAGNILTYLHKGRTWIGFVLIHAKNQILHLFVFLLLYRLYFCFFSLVNSASHTDHCLCLSDHWPHGEHSQNSSCKRPPSTPGDWFGSFPSVTKNSLYSEVAKWTRTPRAQTHHHRWQQCGHGVSLHTRTHMQISENKLSWCHCAQTVY